MPANLMNMDQARIINPILTDVAQGYLHQPLVADCLFPRVPVKARAGQVLTFGKESFRLANSLRAPGEQIARINTSYGTTPFKLEQHALGVTVPIEHQEEAAAVAAVDLLDEDLNAVISQVRLGIEVEAATLATTAANYNASNKATLAGTSQLSDPGSDPFVLVGDARETVRGKVGVRPNVMLIGPSVLNALLRHAKILDRLKYTSSAVPSLEDLARLFQVEKVVVGEAVYADASDNFVDVWGKVMLLAYVAAGSKSRKTPSYGYSYELDKSPVVTEPEFNRKTRSFEAEFIYEHGLYVTAKDAGFLYSAAVA